LIIEEDRLKAKLRKLLLEEEGYSVCVTKSVEEAFDDPMHFSPHLILLDSEVSGGPVLESLRKLKAHTKFESSKIFIMILNAKHLDKIWAKEAGFDGCIKKPIDTRTFATHVSQHLQGGSETSDELCLHFNDI
jgi:DNA-binding response OmpR family regulator